VIELVPATPAHVGTIAARMREMDVIECQALGRNPKQALRLGLIGSVHVLTAKLNGRPEAMMGLTPVSAIEGTGAPWFLGTEAVYDHPRAMLALGPKVLAIWRDSSPSLSNVVAQENVRAIRMLRRWGFEIGSEVTMIGGVAFLTFSMER
jgi:hypothetical protein